MENTKETQNQKGLHVEYWLDRFFDPDNYPDQTCAIYVDGRLIGFHDDFALAVRKAFSISCTGFDRKVRFSISLLSAPYSNLSAYRREQTDIVRKSMDAVFVRDQRFGSKNSWSDTAMALLIQAESQFLKATYYDHFASIRRCKHDDVFVSVCEQNGLTVEDLLEVGFSSANNLRFYCETNNEVKQFLLDRLLTSSPLKRIISEACLQTLACKRLMDDKPMMKNYSECERIASMTFLRWFDFSKDSDNRVTACLARKYICDCMSMKK